MARTQRDDSAARNRVLLARPLEALVFLLPLLLFYEIGSWHARERVIAFDLLRSFFELFGNLGTLAPSLTVVIVLLVTHLFSRQPWRVRWNRVAWMYVEAVLLAVPLVALIRSVRLTGDGAGDSYLLDDVALGIGAGIYEELVFRLILISLVVLLGVDVFRAPAGWVGVCAVVCSALAFAAHHHPPIGTEPFTAPAFAFRTLAGLYLAGVFWFRGYGAAAGAHAAYNVTIVALGL
jgi:hypothetical protein